MKVIVLAGGGGTRLFPLSRTLFPKQFLKLTSDKSLLALTVRRFLQLVRPEDMVVVTNQEYYFHVKDQLEACGAGGARILTEPVARNTAPAVAFAARYCVDEMGAAGDEVLFVTPADHVIDEACGFTTLVRQAASAAATGRVVTFGVTPTKPETGYGYIHAGAPYAGGGLCVQSFGEKPDLATAEAYLKAGGYYWNSGMFCFTADCLFGELAAHSPEIAGLAARPFAELKESFASMPSISLDYAVAEKSASVVMIPFPACWNDIGSWDAIYEVLGKDGDGNALRGDCLPVNCKNSLLLGSSRLIAGVGLEDVLVVETDDVILVAKRGESQQVKDLVGELKARGRREADEHSTMFRPWGSYTVLGEGPGYKMKKIAVKPGGCLSLQMHYHRSEHWVVIGGTARVTVDGEVRMVHENESIFIPMSTKHRLENPGRIPLEIIEVQNGHYLEEDDIVRFDDVYGRP